MAFSVSTQHMRAQQAHLTVIDGPKRRLFEHGRTNQTIDFVG
jgi:hypothetical protein